jgi:DNA topoisomerase-2
MSKASDYDKLTQREHILVRSDTYIGSTKQTTQIMDVYDSEEKIIKSKIIKYTPGFLKIFDEALINARDASETDKTCNTINIWYNKEQGYIRIFNNGDKSIPVEEHPKHKTLVPSMIFGELLTSSNYDDNMKRTTGGRNGLGSKCLGNLVSVPLWDGTFKLAKDITINDKLIGDDGNIRNIKSIITGTGQMYEVSQAQGESYKVNDQHILTLHMPDHKVIFWNTTKCAWSVLWWNNDIKCINAKYFSAYKPRITCPECNEQLHSHLPRHYKRKHKGIEVPKNIRKSPTIIPEETEEIKQAYNECVKYCETIDDNNVFDISIQDYMKLNNTTKMRLAGVRGKCINWTKKDVELDPYILGLWLGDGFHTGYGVACYGEKDPEIIEYLENWGKNNDATLKQQSKYVYNFSSTSNYGKYNCAPLKKQLAKYNLIKNKHIPEDYIINDRDTRLKVLAGIIDTDGTVQRNGTRIGITQGMNHEKLAYQIVYLARSLGFNCQYCIKDTTWTWKEEKRQGKAVNINISGIGVEDIPTLLPRKKCKSPISHNTSKSTGFITIKNIDIDDYIGIHIDGNERFLINDFTVTHNCANIYSTSFTVEVGDAERGKKFIQEWTDNMLNTSGPKVTKYSKKSYVDITFYPDLKRFGLETLDDDHMNLFYRRAIDIAGTCSDKIKVSFNDEKINVGNFKQYIQLYYTKDEIYYDDSNERWKVGVLYIQDSNNKVVSFVNGIATYKGGSHVNHVVDKIIKQLVDNHIKKKNKDIKISPAVLKENLVFFISAIVENPAFDSQTKETLTNEPKEFGSKYEVSETFIKKLAKCGIVEQVLDFAKFKEGKELKKNDGKKQKTIHGIPKLEDANEAGGKNSSKCALILTEGDSAKAFAVAGLSIIGRDYYGVFPLKGKMLNVREASVKQITENEEISNLKKILGLKQGCKYNNIDDFNTLRYGRIIALTDQDTDGSHIKGLIMNMFHSMWPELVEKEGFITSMATPIVKAFKGKDTMTFYNITEYEEWLEKVGNAKNSWKIKYYKGLGTSTAIEAKEYFVDIQDKLIKYIWENKAYKESNMTEDENALTLAFQKNRADDRKEWLMKYDRNEILTYEERAVSYYDFIHKDLIHFSNYDNNRSLPHIMDGFKPSQRKILYGAFLRGLDKDEIKVAQLAGFVSDKAAYHHGEMSLNGAIVGMAQDYVGSNNINILAPLGNYGTRHLGGKDAASSRYIFTKIPEISSMIFKKVDNNIVNKQEEDGMMIEPEYYAPIIPMILVNGATGIGTGFSTEIPCFNPIDIINNLLGMLENKNPFLKMTPYYNNFNGIIDEITETSYETRGLYTIKKNKLTITELPIGVWTQNYKEFLEKLYETDQLKKNKDDRFFIGYKEFHTDTMVSFELEFTDGYLDTVKDIYKTFHLTSRISINNMHLYSTEGRITKYNNISDILEEYYIKRLEMYIDRRNYILAELKKELDLISNKARFILMVVSEELIINKRKRIEIEKELAMNDFPKLGANNSYDYLLSMALYQLTYEKIEELKKLEKEKQAEYDRLNKMTADVIWKNELIELKTALEKHQKNTNDINDKSTKMTKPKTTKKAK